ncbi:prolyl 4-hydroxylase alpha [Colletotrichum sojae]|uniref:Prolyl 4-hydroxylase alpha n=1 Tax=Colletotrichum sojae TaxID=2175907 RepID=A0A8H6JAC9_9PEZI|nr:prolyl 4-hydroxylase alpha [Colletotrichum sojae]
MRLRWVAVLCAIAGVACRESDDNDLQDYICKHSSYQIHIFSQSPLVIYITNFITPFERGHLRKITNGTFHRSNVLSRDGETVSSQRTSSSTTVIPDVVIDCILERARQFQGLDMPHTHLEPIQLVHYGLGEQYDFHTDWFGEEYAAGHGSARAGGNRVSSFFAYVEASEDIVGGGTNFPRLQAPPGKEWCRYLDCDEPWDAGVTFRPVEGNAVFWTNLVDGGRGGGDERVLHAGLPVARGLKVGMNIWTKQGPHN